MAKSLFVLAVALCCCATYTYAWDIESALDSPTSPAAVDTAFDTDNHGITPPAKGKWIQKFFRPMFDKLKSLRTKLKLAAKNQTLHTTLAPGHVLLAPHAAASSALVSSFASPIIKWVKKIKAKDKATGKWKGKSKGKFKGKAKGIWQQLRLKAKHWFVKKHNISYSSSSPKGKFKRKVGQWFEHGRKKHHISYSSSGPASSTQAVMLPTKGKSKGKSKGKAEAKWQQWVHKSKQWFEHGRKKQQVSSSTLLPVSSSSSSANLPHKHLPLTGHQKRARWWWTRINAIMSCEKQGKKYDALIRCVQAKLFKTKAEDKDTNVDMSQHDKKLWQTANKGGHSEEKIAMAVNSCIMSRKQVATFVNCVKTKLAKIKARSRWSVVRMISTHNKHGSASSSTRMHSQTLDGVPPKMQVALNGFQKKPYPHHKNLMKELKQWFTAKGNSQGNSQSKHELDTSNVLIAKPHKHQTKQVEHDFEVELAAEEMTDTTQASIVVSNAKWSQTVANTCIGLAILLCMVAAAMLACRRPRIQVITMEDLFTDLVPDKFVVPTQDTTFYTSEVKHVEPEQI